MKSIQTKLTVTILIIFLVSLSMLGGLNYWKARDIVTQNITSDMQKQAVNSAGGIGDWLEARKAELRMIAAVPVVQSGNPEAVFPFLVNAAKESKVYDAVCYADTSGTFITSTGARGSIADREYFQKAIRGESAVSNPVIAKSNGHLIAPVAVPVKVDGKVIGVVYGTVNMEVLTQKVLSIKVGQTGYAFITQGDGLRIIHPDKERAMKVNPLKDANAAPGQKAVTERIVKGETGISVYNFNGNDKYYAYAPIPGTSWSLAINVPVTEVTGAVSALTTMSVVTIVVVLIIAGLIIAWYARRIAKPLRHLEAAANQIAGGNISQNRLGITSNDEIGRLGQSFEKMTENLRVLIKQVSQATEQVAASAEELTASAEQSAQATNQVAASISEVALGAEKQVNAVGETSAVIEQMSAGIQQVATNANNMAGISDKTADAAKNGSKAVETAINQMINIEKTVTNSAEVVSKLGERSKEIGQIVDTISGIAGQTNLLALNAAIEAARAGEQGRGFAVVADEVRKLAEQSHDAAKQIASLIREIQSETDKAVVAMSDGTREVKLGAEVVNTAGQAFGEIVKLINQVSEQATDITAAIQQMASGSQQIVTSVREVDKIGKDIASQTQTVSAATEEQSASMEEIASSSESLSQMAQELQRAVSKFRV